MEKTPAPEELIYRFRYAVEKARENPDRYAEWIKNEIEQTIEFINSFNKVYVLGGLGARLIQATPTLHNQLIATYDGPGKENIGKEEHLLVDDQIELLLEHAMSIATAYSNDNALMPSIGDIQNIYDRLAKIKSNISFSEIASMAPEDGKMGDQWIRSRMMQNTIHVRGDGHHIHVQEVFKEMFAPFNTFLIGRYGFDANELYEIIIKLDHLVYSKVGNILGSMQSHARLMRWMEKVGKEDIYSTMVSSGKHFIQQFTEANPDLYHPDAPESVMSYSLDNVEGYNMMFWVIPETDKERLIFEKLSMSFGDNALFLQPEKFKAFPLNDTLIKLKPLIKENDRYYHFSMNLAFRNIFQIAENLLQEADERFYQDSFRGNANRDSKDNYIEHKVMSLFKKMLPDVEFYHSLAYTIVEGNKTKKTELDILGIGKHHGYIIEVKAGELNQKHRRGAIKGLKDRIKETIGEGSYQCHRALKFILDNEHPSFEYVADGQRKVLTVNKNDIKAFYKISVTFEHFSTIAINLKYLIDAGVLSSDYKWAWIVSLYDLMIFADLIESEADFHSYLDNRLALYERSDIVFTDEIDVFGFFLQNRFPLGTETPDEIIQMVGFKEEIDQYYTKSGLGMAGVDKPKHNRS